MISVLAITIASMAAAMVVLGLRLSGANAERDKAIASRHTVETTASAIAKEFGQYRKHKEAQMEALREDIEALENDLANCTTPGSRRERLRSLLSKAEARAPDSR